MAANTEAGKMVDEVAGAAQDTATSLTDQLAALKKQVEELYAERKKYMAQARDAAEGYAARAADTAQEQYEAVADKVREKPGQSLLIAAVAGFILARIISR